MVSILVQQNKLVIDLNARERALLGRPNLSLELNRVTKVTFEPLPGKDKLGVLISRRSIFGGATGEWRSGSSRIMVFGGRTGANALRITLKHPSVDEFWYSGSAAKQLFDELTEKLAK